MMKNITSGTSANRILVADLVGFATCPLCHTPDTVVTNQAVSGGADWICSRCSHPWDRVRLANAAAYAASLSLRAASAAGTARSLS
jgi:transposase-like protein